MACCVCSGKAAPGAPAASTGMCAGKKIADGFDRVKTYHQKFTAQVRRKKSTRSERAQPARGLHARRKGTHCSRAFERCPWACATVMQKTYLDAF